MSNQIRFLVSKFGFIARQHRSIFLAFHPKGMFLLDLWFLPKVSSCQTQNTNNHSEKNSKLEFFSNKKT